MWRDSYKDVDLAFTSPESILHKIGYYYFGQIKSNWFLFCLKRCWNTLHQWIIYTSETIDPSAFAITNPTAILPTTYPPSPTNPASSGQ